MKRNEIQQKFVDIVRDELGYDETTVITASTRLEEDLEADSLDCVEIIMAVENEYNITISEDYDFDNLTVGQCVDRIVELIEKQKNESNETL